jgi:hypothetical protein
LFIGLAGFFFLVYGRKVCGRLPVE